MAAPLSLFATRAPFAPPLRRYTAAADGEGWSVYNAAGCAIYSTAGETRTTTPQSRALRMAAELNKES